MLPNPGCKELAKIGRFSLKSSLIIKEIEGKGQITGIKWNTQELAIQVKNGQTENFSYLKLP